MLYDITVLTVILQGKRLHVRDEITFYGVGDPVRSTIAESCKATVFKLIKFKESGEPNAWHLKYRTLVKEAGTHSVVSDSRMITFPAMDGPSMLEFKQWAIQQLRETTDAVNAEIEQGPVATKKRNRVMALLKMLVGRS
jgi:hypothetical protein